MGRAAKLPTMQPSNLERKRNARRINCISHGNRRCGKLPILGIDIIDDREVLVYGPYEFMPNRKGVIFYDSETRTRVGGTSYARWKMQKAIGRKLRFEEKVDHIDGNCSNDDLSNLQILSNQENVIKSKMPKEMITFICPVCKKEATKPAFLVRGNRRQGKAGPYCGHICADADRYKTRNKLAEVLSI